MNDFLIELSGLLKELMCPYEVLVHSHATNKMLTVESRYLLLEYLIAELMTVKMAIALKPKDEKNVITLVRRKNFHYITIYSITVSLTARIPNSICSQRHCYNSKLGKTPRKHCPKSFVRKSQCPTERDPPKCPSE